MVIRQTKFKLVSQIDYDCSDYDAMDSVTDKVDKLNVSDTGYDLNKEHVCVTDAPDTNKTEDLLVCGTKKVRSSESEPVESRDKSHDSEEPATVSVSTPEHSDSESPFSTPSPSQLCHVELLEITFNVLPDTDSDCDDDEMSPYIELGGSFKKTFDLCMDRDEVVLTNEQIVMPEEEKDGPKYVTLILDYPLDDDYEFKIYPDHELGFTRGFLIQEIKRTYDRVYAEEEESSSIPVGNIPGMLNRVSTDGNYGVWGHDLGDLALHTVKYNPQRNLFWLGVDS